jgi:hypothetical protein
MHLCLFLAFLQTFLSKPRSTRTSGTSSRQTFSSSACSRYVESRVLSRRAGCCSEEPGAVAKSSVLLRRASFCHEEQRAVAKSHVLSIRTGLCISCITVNDDELGIK